MVLYPAGGAPLLYLELLPPSLRKSHLRELCDFLPVSVGFSFLVTARVQITISARWASGCERLLRRVPLFSSSFHTQRKHHCSLHRGPRQREAPRIGDISPKTPWSVLRRSHRQRVGSISRAQGDPTPTVPSATSSGASTSSAIGPQTSLGQKPGLSCHLLPASSTGPTEAHKKYSVDE